jgi:hypothetical protein
MINDAKRIPKIFYLNFLYLKKNQKFNIRNVESTTDKSVSKILKISIIYCCCGLSLNFFNSSNNNGVKICIN